MKPPVRRRPARRHRLAPLVALAALALDGCGGDRPSGPNVLLITLDTTRPDRLGVYGNPDARTPVLDRLARQGAVVEWAIGDVPVTLPSHSTIMTGVPALGHGVRYNADFRLSDDAETLAEVLGDSGWDTGAVVSALVLDSKFGIAQGFRFFEDDLTPGYVKYDESLYPDETHWLPKADRRAPETVDESLAWLGGEARRPFFFWMHFYDPHFPFDPPPPWPRALGDLYLAEIASVDRELVRVTRWLEERGLSDDTIVLVTGDHGEGLDQHREDGHGIFLYDDTVRVPLLLRAPGRVAAGTVSPEQVRTIDLAPTLLDLVGGLVEPMGLGGSLVPLLTGSGPVPDPTAYCESIKTKLFYSGAGLKALRTRAAKFVWAPRPELYDLVADPGETRNLFSTEDPRSEAMVVDLEREVRDILSRGLTAVEPANPDAETLEALASLGYTGGSDGTLRPGSAEQEMALVGYDPKDLVDVSMGAREIQNGFYESGEKKLLRFFETAPTPEDDPRMARLWAAAHQNYAKIWMVRGDYAEAAEQYRLAQIADPGYDLARWSRIYALNLAGKPELADAEAEQILARWPRSNRVRLHRALAAALMGDFERAIEVLDFVAREADPNGETARVARWYRTRFAGPQREAALEAYLSTESRRRGDGARPEDHGSRD
jgi:arylsulfatase A-like enzyme